MKKLNFIFAALISIMFTSSMYGQSPAYSKILKNVHADAVDLYHDLNASKDSLNMRHDNEQILRVQFISHKSKDKKKYDFGKNDVSVPLNNLGVGRYTVATYLTNGQVVVYGIVRLLPIPTKDLEKNVEDLRVAKLKTPKKIEVIKKVTKTAVAPKEEVKEEVAVAEAAPKKKKSTKVITNPSRAKKAVATAKPKRKTPPQPKGPTLADKLRAKAKRDALAAVEAKKEEIRQRQLDKQIRESAPKDLKVTKVSYNLSKADSETMVKQSREEYRKNNLRPNGKPYNN